ncbi:ADP-ribosylglycohydrolase family protein [Caballeronia sp. LZ035]|uniref:ADP-ribosylglycohydrolase family protein n=1 Tax=Caballeronia sp. LZ035 TaxID=3038568 RepID=UPI0028608657|nr:ADP-ribosylglycohydrolase family protein [Caballeronia sp. LZ035]MDR5760695.1 ADP-ribosylglycohydrolase family protein [Caballeronia sp. LZ035]
MNVHHTDHNQRCRAGLYGLLIGDALGVPYEFHDAADLPPESAIEMEPPAGFRRAHRGVLPGTWSDDGAQALCLLESLIHRPQLDLADFAQRLLAWYEQGHMTPDGHVFDVGIQTSRAFDELRHGASPASAGPRGERDNGNGALMRCLPVVFVAASEDEAVRLAMHQGLVTHGHLRSQLCCALYTLVARRLLEGANAIDAIATAEAHLRRRFEGTPAAAEMQRVLDARREPPRGSGYVVDSLWSALHCLLDTRDVESCLRRAIALGNDTDTTAAIAGGLAGLLHGFRAIPPRWITALRGRDIVEALLDKLPRSA